MRVWVMAILESLFLIVLILIGVVNAALTSGELGSALHSVPSTSKSIRRFPEQGSRYDGLLESFRTVALNANKTNLLVSARDYIFQLHIKSFNIMVTNSSSNVLWLPANSREYQQCYTNRLEKIECNNTMSFAVYDAKNIFACGTYSLNGRCWLISSETMKIINVVRGEFSDKNEFAPKKPDGKIVGLTAKNGVVFGAIKKSNSFTIRAILTNGVHIKTGKPTLQLSAPTFITSFEADDGFVYFFFTENAYEVSDRQTVYSRVGRVCSYDRGSQNEYGFITFTKSQIVCYKKGGVPPDSPDYYDHIQSATTVEVHDKDGNSETFIYASFTATIRSTGSSALCRYKLKDIQNLFQTSKYFVKKTENGNVKYEAEDHPQPKLDVSRMRCNAKLKTDVMDGSGVMWITSNPLLKDDIEPFDKNTVATFRGERVTSLAVEDIHFDVNKTDSGVHALFAGTDSGKILKVVMNGTNHGEPYLAEEIQAVGKPGAITTLLFQENYVIGSGETIPLIRVDKERCESKYIMCSDCLKARDPYCAWSKSLKKCTRAADLPSFDRLQDLASGNDKKCPPVDVTISCSLVIVDNIPGAWTAIQCTGHGKIPPKVLAWKKDEARLDIDQNIFGTRSLNESSQMLIIKGYTTKDLGKYGCIVGLNSNKSECSVRIEGQKPEVNCSRNSTNCTCQVSGYPFPSVSKVVNGNQTIRLGHGINPIAIQQGVILFAFNSFGDDVFTCPVHMVTTTKIPTTTATTTIPTTTATTISSTTFSTTQTTSAKSTNRSTTRGTTAKPTTIRTTRKTTTTTTEITSSKQTTIEPTTKKSTMRTTMETTTRKDSPLTPGPRVNCPKDQSDKWLIPFIVVLILLILVVVAVALFICFYFMRSRDYSDEEDEFDGKKGTLKISPSKQTQRSGANSDLNVVLFQKRKKVKKADSTKPLVKKESKNGTTHSDVDSGKTAKETDDVASNEDKAGIYLMHVKT